MKDKIKKTVYNKIKETVMGDDSKNTKNSKDVRNNHADTVIRNHVIWSMGAGLIPVLVADIFAVSALQLDMIRQLCKVYDLDFQDTRGKAIVTSLTSSTLARLGARSLVKLIPGVGTYLGGVTVSIFAGASTYALGEVFKKHFESGGTILDFDPDRVRNYYAEKFEKGKNIAKEWKKETPNPPAPEDMPEAVEDTVKEAVEEMIESTPEPTPEPAPPTVDPDDPIARLKELADLKDRGAITETEFKKMKKKLLDDF